MRVLLVGSLLVAGWVALGALGTARAQPLVECESPSTGDELRHPEARLPERTLHDLWAMPASIVQWDMGDVAVFGATALSTGALMLPPKDSLDVRFQDWLQRNERGALDRTLVKIKTVPEAVALASAGALLFGTAYLTGHKPLFEYGSLSVEALAIAQFYHIASKLIVGREGPHQGGGDGEVFGPTKLFFPGGTPSGHAATAYALLAVAAEYWQAWPVYVFGHLAGLYIASSLVYTRQHFVSDVLWGGVMGYAIGRWVVRHRSSRYRCRERETVWQRTIILPVLSARGLAISAGFRF